MAAVLSNPAGVSPLPGQSQTPDAQSTPSKPPPTIPYSWKTKNPTARRVYIRDVDLANREIALLNSDSVGFDLEWKPTFLKGAPENPVALVQIATYDTILLIQVSAMQDFSELPSKLQDLLESSEIVKAGVAIQNDTKKLFKDWKVSTRNCVDLSLLARSVDNVNWKGKYSNPIGLARLVDLYEGLALGKGKITRSNWENVLSEAQQEYASNDAHSGYIIYKKLLEMAKSMAAIPESVCYTFDSVRGRLCEPTGMQWHPRNPNYDPGPPPPIRAPKEPKVANVTVHAESPHVVQAAPVRTLLGTTSVVGSDDASINTSSKHTYSGHQPYSSAGSAHSYRGNHIQSSRSHARIDTSWFQESQPPASSSRPAGGGHNSRVPWRHRSASHPSESSPSSQPGLNSTRASNVTFTHGNLGQRQYYTTGKGGAPPSGGPPHFPVTQPTFNAEGTNPVAQTDGIVQSNPARKPRWRPRKQPNNRARQSITTSQRDNV
ncbi:ribonuclease H-like domain-containing protein [Crucibulum laeve]|uniref:Ribonuclease H-like domain-containing protein n=1 Tax=Crucibulum laeve TaxID=68775 RepID=A0A5C3M9F4_9AGAR|nr:ribonuclease H-like domain-containing protein [Crucibulum laeve]